jgi:hypothetical protein
MCISRFVFMDSLIGPFNDQYFSHLLQGIRNLQIGWYLVYCTMFWYWKHRSDCPLNSPLYPPAAWAATTTVPTAFATSRLHDSVGKYFKLYLAHFLPHTSQFIPYSLLNLLFHKIQSEPKRFLQFREFIIKLAGELILPKFEILSKY